MGKMYRIKGSLPLLLISAILMLCAGFLIVSCGNKPQQKTSDSDKDSYALDLSACPSAGACSALPEGSDVTPIPSIAGREITIEAWVKNRSTSTPAATTGGIFGRYDDFGAALYVKAGIPKFGIGRIPITTTSTEPTGCTSKGTSTECVISSGITPAVDVWTHVAGVLVNADHSAATGNGLHAACSGAQAGAEAQMPHMDIYIDGVFADCSTSGSMFANNPGDEKMSIGVPTTAGSLDSVGGKFNAAIDEIRFWGYARTPGQINECKGTELGIGGTCDRGDSGLIAYYRLNEGEGSDVTDFAGNAFNGALEGSDGIHFESGWVLRNDALTPTRAD